MHRAHQEALDDDCCGCLLLLRRCDSTLAIYLTKLLSSCYVVIVSPSILFSMHFVIVSPSIRFSMHLALAPKEEERANGPSEKHQLSQPERGMSHNGSRQQNSAMNALFNLYNGCAAPYRKQRAWTVLLPSSKVYKRIPAQRLNLWQAGNAQTVSSTLKKSNQRALQVMIQAPRTFQ